MKSLLNEKILNRKTKTQELSKKYQKQQRYIENKFYNEYKNIHLKIFEESEKLSEYYFNSKLNENILSLSKV